MKKHNLSKLLEQEFYVLLSVRTLNLVIAGVGIYQSSNKRNNDNLVELDDQYQK